MNKNIKRTLVVLTVVLTIVFAFLTITFHLAKVGVNEEWEQKFPSEIRTENDMRGIVDNMYHYQDEVVPTFIPQATWDDELCAANIVNGTNYILGEKRLKVAPAWLFSQVNEDELRLVYQRTDDFAVRNGRIVERNDRSFRLAKLLKTVGTGSALTSDRLYIIGYHYRYTRSDKLIIEAGGDLNSHLMLILGRYDGNWYGYHLYHDPQYPQDNPFRIDNIGDCEEGYCMPNYFDVVKIWEVLESRMASPEKGSAVMLVQNSQPYRKVSDSLSGSGRLNYIWDMLSIYLWGGGDNFSRTVPLDTLVEVVPPQGQARWRDQLLGFYKGVAIRRHEDESVRGPYGLEYQCVELINRYYVQRLGHRNMTQTGHAHSYFTYTENKDLVAYENGGSVRPASDDILVFREEEGFGHVALVVEITESEVCFVQQNTPLWYQCLPLSERRGTWHVDPIGLESEQMPCLGWARREEQ
ncbi:MAG: CHAP domain-containing protein [Parcubacteria group bacterium]|nr:CHAP domain-containing protein [Parcubacteria group bacterium]